MTHLVNSSVGPHQSLLRFNERSVDAVHFVVEAAGVAQVVSRAVPAPQRRGHGAAVDALPALGGHVVDQVCTHQDTIRHKIEKGLLK